MGEINAAGLIIIFKAIGDAIEVDKGRLSELDGVIGDADHGVTMSIGFTAVNEALAKLDPSADPTTVFNTAAKSFLNAVGASSGPLYGTAFMRAGAAVKGKAVVDRDAMADCIQAMAKGMQDRGKAERGEKTMMDAWLPAADAAQAAKARGDDSVACLEAAVAAAETGAEGDQGDARHQGPGLAAWRAGAGTYGSGRRFRGHHPEGDDRGGARSLAWLDLSHAADQNGLRFAVAFFAGFFSGVAAGLESGPYRLKPSMMRLISSSGMISPPPIASSDNTGRATVSTSLASQRARLMFGPVAMTP